MSPDRTPGSWGWVVAWCVLLCAGAAAAHDLSVSCAPHRLELGRDGECRLQVNGPPDARRVRIAAARGKVEARAADSRGTWNGWYRPPSTYAPGVDVVAAAVDTGDRWRYAVAAIALIGRGRARVVTRPGAEVLLHIAGVPFGPVVADDRGEAFVDVVVPPGETEGIDATGRRVPLGVPPMPWGVWVSPHGMGEAMPDPPVFLWVAVTPSGALDEGVDPPRFTASCGRTAVEPVQPAVWMVTWLPAPGCEAVIVTAADARRGEVSVRRVVSVASSAADGAMVELRASPPPAPHREPAVPSRRRTQWVAVGGGGWLGAAQWRAWLVEAQWGLRLDGGLRIAAVSQWGYDRASARLGDGEVTASTGVLSALAGVGWEHGADAFAAGLGAEVGPSWWRTRMAVDNREEAAWDVGMIAQGRLFVRMPVYTWHGGRSLAALFSVQPRYALVSGKRVDSQSVSVAAVLGLALVREKATGSR